MQRISVCCLSVSLAIRLIEYQSIGSVTLIDDNAKDKSPQWFLLFRCVRISIRGLVRRSVGRLVGWLVRNAFVKIVEKWTFMDSK